MPVSGRRICAEHICQRRGPAGLSELMHEDTLGRTSIQGLDPKFKADKK